MKVAGSVHIFDGKLLLHPAMQRCMQRAKVGRKRFCSRWLWRAFEMETVHIDLLIDS